MPPEKPKNNNKFEPHEIKVIIDSCKKIVETLFKNDTVTETSPDTFYPNDQYYTDNLQTLINNELMKGLCFLSILENSTDKVEIEVSCSSLTDLKKGYFKIEFDLTSKGDFYHQLKNYSVEFRNWIPNVTYYSDDDYDPQSKIKYIERLESLATEVEKLNPEKKLKYILSEEEYKAILRKLKLYKDNNLSDIRLPNRIIYQIKTEGLSVNSLNEEGLTLVHSFLNEKGNVVTVSRIFHQIYLGGVPMYICTNYYLVYTQNPDDKLPQGLSSHHSLYSPHIFAEEIIKSEPEEIIYKSKIVSRLIDLFAFIELKTKYLKDNITEDEDEILGVISDRFFRKNTFFQNISLIFLQMIIIDDNDQSFAKFSEIFAKYINASSDATKEFILKYIWALSIHYNLWNAEEDLNHDDDKWGTSNKLEVNRPIEINRYEFEAAKVLINYILINKRTFLDIESLLKRIIYFEVII